MIKESFSILSGHVQCPYDTKFTTYSQCFRDLESFRSSYIMWVYFDNGQSQLNFIITLIIRTEKKLGHWPSCVMPYGFSYARYTWDSSLLLQRAVQHLLSLTKESALTTERSTLYFSIFCLIGILTQTCFHNRAHATSAWQCLRLSYVRTSTYAQIFARIDFVPLGLLTFTFLCVKVWWVLTIIFATTVPHFKHKY